MPAFEVMRRGLRRRLDLGSVVLRRYEPGEVVFVQGESGSTIFYVLTDEDLVALREHQCEVAYAGEPSTTEQPGRQREQLLAERDLALGRIDDRDQGDGQGAPATALLRSGRELRRSSSVGDSLRHLGEWIRSTFWREEPTGPRPANARVIPVDSGTSIDSDTMRGDIRAGELFGESNSFHDLPRSVTVVVNEPCYMVEMLSSVYDRLTENAEFRRRQWETYRVRRLGAQFRAMRPFRALTDEQLDWLLDPDRNRVEFVSIDSGDVIFEEGQPSDGVYVVHRGLVKVVENLRCRLVIEDFNVEATSSFDKTAVVPDDARFERLFDELSDLMVTATARIAEDKRAYEEAKEAERERRTKLVSEAVSRGERPPSFPPVLTVPPRWMPGRARLAILLAELVRERLRDSCEVPSEELDLGKLPSPDDIEARKAIVAALNAFITAEKGTAFATRRDSGARRRWDSAREITREVPDPILDDLFLRMSSDTRCWSQADIWLVQRRLLEILLPKSMPRRIGEVDRRRVLAYPRAGELVGLECVSGEIEGVTKQETRQVTCVAYDHPDSPDGLTTMPDHERGYFPQVELVRIPLHVVQTLLDASPPFVAEIQETAERGRSANAQSSRTVPVQSQPEVETLGLMQGEELMLIDLDSCTRCNVCVEACIASHDDGRTRLYLDGPRWMNYLVPTTCRSCVDPVCMIGCPVGSMSRGERGEIVIEPWCIGCKLCADQCPYGAIQMESALDADADRIERHARGVFEGFARDSPQIDLLIPKQVAVVCDLCASSSHGLGPACVYACPHESALRVNALDELQQVFDVRSK